MMRKSIFIYAISLITLIYLTQGFIVVSAGTFDYERNHRPNQLNKEKIYKLEQEGFARSEMLNAAYISVYANKGIETIFKKNKSWDETANGVNLEEIKNSQVIKNRQFYQNNKEKIVHLISDYTKVSAAQINQFLQNDVDLHFLIAAAAISKTSNTGLSQIIYLKKEGKSFNEIMNSVRPNQKQVFKEMQKLNGNIKNMK